MTEPQDAALCGCRFFSQTPERIFVPEDFGSDEQLMISTAEQFVRKEVMTCVERLDAQEPGLMPALIRKAGALGFCGPDTPEAYGGLGLSKNLAARMLEFLSLNGSFSVTIGITSGISQVGLALFGSEELKQRFLPSLASGEQIGAYALSEPNSGSDAMSLSTRAERRGDRWVLNGTKMWISNAQWAHVFLVMAKTGTDRVSAFIVERGAPGVSVAREEHKMGLKGSSTARVLLENAEVPESNLLYEEGKGHYVAFNALNLGRFKLSSMSLGPAREAITQAARYAQERKQFGRPIAEFGLIRQKFAMMASRFFGIESMIYRTGDLIDRAFEFCHADRPEDPIAANRRAAEEYAVECSACKVLSTEVEASIVDEALQVFGGYGFTEEFPMARLYRDARVSRIYEGTNEINRLFLTERLLRRSRESRASLQSVKDSFVSELAGRAFARCVQPPGEKMEQWTTAALSDLAMLSYAEQSSRLRALRVGGMAQALDALFRNWANQAAAAAYQAATGDSVSVPAPIPVDIDEVAMALLRSERPL